MTNLPTISLRMAEGRQGPLATLFGKGVRLPVEIGRSLRRTLVDQIGLDPDYLENRVQTVFLNGRPVDDFDRAIVGPGAVIALSAAMPGLAGATLRRGGHLSAMRRQISQTAEAEAPAAGDGLITLKLFNVVAREAGPAILAGGIIVSAAELDELSKTIAAHGELPAGALQCGQVLLKVLPA